MFVAGEFLLIALMQIYCEPVGKRIWKIDQRLAKLQQKMAKFFLYLRCTFDAHQLFLQC